MPHNITEIEIDRWTKDKKFTRDQVLKCKDAFDLFDLNGNEYIEIDELKAALENMGHCPTEEELYLMMNEGGVKDHSGISFDDFMSIIHKQKEEIEVAMRQDIINAFVALGGNDDMTGNIDPNEVKKIIHSGFNMVIDLDKLLNQYDRDKNRNINFDEFKEMMTS